MGPSARRVLWPRGGVARATAHACLGQLGHRGYGNSAQVVCSMATTAITSMPGFINSYTSLPVTLGSFYTCSPYLLPLFALVTQGERPFALCHVGH